MSVAPRVTRSSIDLLVDDRLALNLKVVCLLHR